MNLSLGNNASTVVAGFGSPHGDDRVGWEVVARLERRGDLPVRVVAVRAGTDLLEVLDGCERLVVVDGCRSGRPSGSTTRLQWPDARILAATTHSTHGLSIGDALRLAESLDLLPEVVEVFGIEVGDCSPGQRISKAVLQAVAELETILDAELREASHARA